MSAALRSENLSSEHLLRATVVLAGRAWGATLSALLVYGGLDLLLGILLGDSWTYFAALIFSDCVLMAGFTLFLLRYSTVALAGSPPAMLVQGAAAAFFTGIAIGIGFILLVVPGVYLATLWLMVVPIIMVEGGGISRAAGRSADLAKGCFWSLFGAWILVSFPYWAVWIGLAVAGVDEHPLVEGLVLLPLGGLAFVISCCLAVVAFLELRDTGRLEQVFA